jgi:hypothetical protein
LQAHLQIALGLERHLFRRRRNQEGPFGIECISPPAA